MKLYGIPASQASRCLWALEELDLDYELELTRPGEETSTAAFTRLNPNRKIPVLVDGDLILWESLAINLYLAQRYGANLLWPERRDSQAQAGQWSFWVSHDVEPHLWRMWQQGDANAAESLRAALTVLEAQLSNSDWLLDDRFSIADLNLESYIIRARRGGYDLGQHTAIAHWIERCEARPARIRVRQMISDYERSARIAGK